MPKDHYCFPVTDPDHIEEAFELLASAHEIAKRNGTGTNWAGFKASIDKLFNQIRRNPVSARTYREIRE